MNRKNFLLSSGLTAFSLSTFGSAIKELNGTFKGDCKTTNDILGPFYRPNAPLRIDLNSGGVEGTPILLRGRVFEEDCTTPIENALVEMWHCNSKGEYDNTSSDYKQRACWKTNKNGEYSFQTILPGKYLNGAHYRPAHIHFRVTVKNVRELISQIYFKGDPQITEDPWASGKKAIHRILPIIPEDKSGSLTVHFDIVMEAI